jgi:hypothetical protein
MTAASACAPVIGASRRRFCVMLGIAALSPRGRQVVLAQRDQDAVVAAREVEALGQRVVLLELRLERLGRAVLDQVGQIGDETRRACAAEVIALREREDLLELIEDQQRDQRVPDSSRSTSSRWCRNSHSDSPGHGVPTCVHSPGRARCGKIACLICSPARGASRPVVDAHVDRAVALRAQARHEAGAQDRGLAQARLAEQHGQQLALHAAASSATSSSRP